MTRMSETAARSGRGRRARRAPRGEEAYGFNQLRRWGAARAGSGTWLALPLPSLFLNAWLGLSSLTLTDFDQSAFRRVPASGRLASILLAPISIPSSSVPSRFLTRFA